MTTTRRKLLQALTRQNPASASELARHLGLTAADVRRHLSILVEEKLVEPAGMRRAAGRGRPVRLYRPAGLLLGDNLPGLADQALGQLLEGRSGEDLESALRTLALRLAGLPGATGVPGPRRLAEAVACLSRMNYQARWEARPGGPRVFLDRCPYAAILDRHPELCRMDAFLLENQLGQPVEQIDRLAQSAQGAVFCSFQARVK